MIEERDSVEAAVSAQWTAILGRIPDDFDADFFTIGGTSLMAAMLIAQLADAFGFEPVLQAAFDHRTVRSMADWIRHQPGARSHRVLPLHADDTEDRPPLLFVPGVNGDLILLNQLTDAQLGRPVWGVESRGFRPEDGAPLRTAEAIAIDLADQFEARLSTRTAHVGGFSTGSMFCIELTAELLRRGWDVRSMAVIGPAMDVEHPTEEYDDLVEIRLRKLVGRHLTDRVVDAGTVAAALRADGLGLPDAAIQDLARRSHVWAGNYYAATRYRPTNPAPIPATVWLEAAERQHAGHWREFFALGGVEVHVHELDHFSLIGEPAAPRQLAQRLRELDAPHHAHL